MDAFYEYMEKQVQGLCNLADDNQNLRALFRNETLRCVFVVEEYFLMMYDLIASTFENRQRPSCSDPT